MSKEDWLKSSIMAKRAVAKARPAPATNYRSSSRENSTTSTGPTPSRVLSIDPGGVVVVETEDAFGGVLTSERTVPQQS